MLSGGVVKMVPRNLTLNLPGSDMYLKKKILEVTLDSIKRSATMATEGTLNFSLERI